MTARTVLLNTIGRDAAEHAVLEDVAFADAGRGEPLAAFGDHDGPVRRESAGDAT